MERLPPAPDARSSDGAHGRAGLLHAILAVEPLPLDPEPAPRERRGWLRLLLAPEHLPEDPPAPARARRSRGLLSLLLEPERLDPP